MDNPCVTCEIELRHCPLYPNACKKLQAHEIMAARDKWWEAGIKEAWREYVVYPITINSERSSGSTQVVFNEKPEFPTFFAKWQEHKREVGQ